MLSVQSPAREQCARAVLGKTDEESTMSSASHSSPRPKIQQVVVHKPLRGRSFSLLYLLPAVFLSAVFNVGVLAALYFAPSPVRWPSG